MQTQLGGTLAQGPVPVHFAYVARYVYSDVVVQNDNFLMLSPYDDRYQTPVNGGCDVATLPAGRKITYPDRLGNVVNRVRVTAPHNELIIAATGRVCLNDWTPAVDDAPLAGLAYGLEAREFLTASQLVDPESVRATAHEAAGAAATLLETVSGVVRWIHENIRYERGNTSVNTTAADVLESRSGVCQDMTHLGLAMLRCRGVPARYVSGLLTRQPGETHAWLEYLHPEQGCSGRPDAGHHGAERHGLPEIRGGPRLLGGSAGVGILRVQRGRLAELHQGGSVFRPGDGIGGRRPGPAERFVNMQGGIIIRPYEWLEILKERGWIMVEPRSISVSPDRWLTDSRVYNLIWLGRWLERADNIARVVNTFARIAVESGSDILALQQSLGNAAAIRGIRVEDAGQSLEMLLKEHEASSIYHSLHTARSNATHVGTVELIRAISEAVMTLERDGAMPATPLDALLFTNEILERMSDVYKVIDDSWFHQEALSEEEVYRRFVQQ